MLGITFVAWLLLFTTGGIGSTTGVSFTIGSSAFTSGDDVFSFSAEVKIGTVLTACSTGCTTSLLDGISQVGTSDVFNTGSSTFKLVL